MRILSMLKRPLLSRHIYIPSDEPALQMTYEVVSPSADDRGFGEVLHRGSRSSCKAYLKEHRQRFGRIGLKLRSMGVRTSVH